MKKNTGFTLIELLVVIAIIGILSSVVLASLNTARAKGNLAKVQAQVNGARVAAENYYSTAGSYGTTIASCDAGMFADTASGMRTYTLLSNYPTGADRACNSTSLAYAMYVSLPVNGVVNYVCIDSVGTSRTSTTTPNITAQTCAA
jgi:prepilin-type N-terminal cleavage/methylation domain-containing protein